MALVVSGATQYTRLPVFVGMTLFVGYLKYPASKRDALRDNYFPWYDIVLAFASLGVFFYYAIEQKRIIQMANRIGTTQIIIGIIGILLLVELCRRSTGVPLIVVVGLFTVYGAWWLTNNNPKTALRNLIYNLFYNLNCGIFSSPITVCASFIVLFIILGSFLEKTGIGTLSAYCGAVSAGAGAGAGIVYLCGDGYQAAIHTVVNALAIVSGIVCDGAMASCAAKIASSVDAALLGYNMYKCNQEFKGGDGIVMKDIETTIKGIGRLGKNGMKETNEEIIRLMIE